MTTNLTLAIVFGYLFIVLLVGVSASVGRKNSLVEFVAASRSFGPVVMYFLVGGAALSAVAFLGGPGWAFSQGAASFYLLGYVGIVLLPWYVLGPLAMRAGTRYGYVTQAQLFADRFQSKALSVVVAAVSILAFVQYVTIQMKAGGYVFEVASGNRIPFWAGAMISYAVVLLYTFLGGVRSVAWTNVLQGVIMLVMAWILGVYFAYALYDGPADMFRKITEAKPTHLLVGPGTNMSFTTYSTSVLVSVLGGLMWPHLFMKAYTAASERSLKLTVILYPTFAICLVPVLLIGFAGVLQVSPQELGPPDRILPWMFTQLEFSPLVVGLILAAALAAAMSTQDTITHAAGSMFTIDIVEQLREKKHTDAQATRWVRIFVVVFGFAAYLVAILGGQTLIALLLGAYGSIVQLLPLTLATFFWPRANAAGALAGFIGGVAFNYLIVLDVVPGVGEIHAGIQGLLINLILLVGVSLLTKPMDPAHLDRFKLLRGDLN